MASASALDWRAIIIACMVSFVAAAIIGFAAGMFGLALFATAGEDGIDAVSQSVVAHVLGIVLGLVPVLIGAVYLVRSVSNDTHKHCLVFGTVSLGLTVALSFAFGDLDFGWHDFVFYVAIVPTAVLGRFVGQHE